MVSTQSGYFSFITMTIGLERLKGILGGNVPQLCLVADYEAIQYQFSINLNTSKNE